MNSLSRAQRLFALYGVGISVLILIPGLFLPVLTVRGTLNPEGVVELANKILDQGMTDAAVQNFRPLINPALLPVLDSGQGGLKGALVTAIGTQLTEPLKSGNAIEVYGQTRSIVGSVRHLYSVGSNTAATLILVFSIVVPLTKSLLVTWAVSQSSPNARRRVLFFVETIAKWSMADVFAVAVVIAYLAAQASQSVSGGAAIVVFNASFGSGFYWFAGYCLLSLAVQQISARFLMRSVDPIEIPEGSSSR
jgi:hypothetical protein